MVMLVQTTTTVDTFGKRINGVRAVVQTALEELGSPRAIDRESVVRHILWGEYRKKRPVGKDITELRWKVSICLSEMGYARDGCSKKNPRYILVEE